MNNFENNYSNILNNILKEKNIVSGRNGKVLMKTAVQIRANLKDGFPLVTGKKIFPKTIAIETEWYLKGQTNIKFLNNNGVHIWDEWADENGDLGPVYGKQLRDFNRHDQLINIVNEAKINPNSRRLLINLWNPIDIKKMQLPPCHYSFQFVIYNKQIDIIVSMRSLDLFIGLPYDIAMYSLILCSFIKELNNCYMPGEVIINAANAHIYEEHIEASKIYINREKTKLPILKMVPKILNFNYKEVVIDGYNPKERIKVKIKK